MRRWLFLSTLLGLTLVLMEFLAFATLWSQGLPSPARWRQEREAVAKPAGVGAAATSSARPPTGGGQAIHPFLGFVQDRDLPENDWVLTADGFPQVPSDPSKGSTEGTIVGRVAGSKPMSEEERRLAISISRRFRVPVEEGYSYFIAAGKELERSGVPFQDLTQLFAETREVVYADDCRHLNQRGNEELGRAIGLPLPK